MGEEIESTMSKGPFQKLHFERRLIMTFALRQSLEILQMPQLELKGWLEQEIEKNPLLELEATEKTTRTLPPRIETESEIASVPTLYEKLKQQIGEAFFSPREEKIANKLLDSLDEKGFLAASVDEVATLFHVPTPKVASVLFTLQTFDPPGIFARDLREAFLIQLRSQGKEDSSAFLLVECCFDDLLHGRYASIKKKLNLSDLSSAMQTLARLSLRPAAAFQQEPVSLALPDLLIMKLDSQWIVDIYEDDLPKFQIQAQYLSLEPTAAEEKEALRAFQTSAKWIIRSLSRRKKMLLEIGKLLVKKQEAFLDQRSSLSSLTIRDLAVELNVHESTLSRALAGKYAATPQGLILLRSLITSSPETLSAKEILKNLVEKEDPQFPLTDDQLKEKLRESGLDIARRTIAKYRGQLKIGSATQRKNSRKKSS